MDNVDAVINRLTEGLRELPTDYVTRVRHFLAEYLGNVHRPVPFGGRAGDFARLDDWLADTRASPYGLLAAPAGRGKSALLLRWCERLLSQKNLEVVYFPVSIRFRTNLAGVVFPALTALLARLHGEPVPSTSNVPEDVWRGLFLGYLARPLPAGRQLVLVLDGIDEAADWSAAGLFTANPPAGLHVVLSARYLANDQDASAWLQRLNWIQPELARTLELYPLDRAGIASVLLQMGFPLEALGTRIDIVSELHRLSEGDPLLVRLYVDDLWKQGEAVIRLQPEQLQRMRPGLAGYFERWWSDQRSLWPEEVVGRETALQAVLNLLAGALGPLSKADVLKLVPDELELRPEALDTCLETLGRFVIGDGMHQGYVFSHPRLASYFLEERLSEEERQNIESRFLHWGKQTQIALSDGSLDAEQASPYIVQYYGAHLERSGLPGEETLALVSNGWRRAWEKLDRGNTGFLGDSERAARVAEREDKKSIADGQRASYLGAEIRSLLCRVSIYTITGNISPRLMREAVRTGIWTPAQGLASVRLIADLAPRARELVALASFTREPLYTDILQEALDTVTSIKEGYARLDALVELAPALTENLLGQVLAMVPTIEDEADQAGILTELAPALSRHAVLLGKALELAEGIEEEEYLALALAGLAPCLLEEQHARVWQMVVETIHDERYRAQALTALAPYFAEELRQEALQNARLMQDGLSRVRLLTELVLISPEPQRAGVMQETLTLMDNIDDLEYRVEILVRLSSCLPPDRLVEALQAVQLLWDESLRAQALKELLPSLSGEHLPEVVRLLRMMRSEEYRSAVMLQLLPGVSAPLMDQLLDIVEGTWDEGYRVELLARLARVIPGHLADRLVEMIQTVTDPGYRVWLMTELEASLTGDRSILPLDILPTFRQMKDDEERIQTLLAIVNRLSEKALAAIFSFMLPQIFNFRWSIGNADRRADILMKLSPRLPEAWLSKAIEQVQGLGNETLQMQVLVALAPRLNEQFLPPALDIVRSLRRREQRGQVLEALVASLPEEHRDERVREMLQVLQILKDETPRSVASSAFVEHLSQPLQPSGAALFLAVLRTMTYGPDRQMLLKAFIPSIAASSFEVVFNEVVVVEPEDERAQELERLAPFVPESLFTAFLLSIRAINSEHWRRSILAALMASLTPDRRTRMVSTLLAMEDESERSSALLALIPFVSEDTFLRLWEMMLLMKDAGRRAWALGMLAQRMPQDFFARFWTTLQAIPKVQGQIWVLNLLVSRMPERFFPELWQAIQQYGNEAWRVKALQTLVPHTPEKHFWQVFEAVQAVSDDRVRYEMLRILLTRIPASPFPAVFQATYELETQWEMRNNNLLMEVVDQVPAEHFMQTWTVVSNDPDLVRQRLLKKQLAGHVPESVFPRIWQEVQSEVGEVRLALVEILIRCVPEASLPQVVDFAYSLPDRGRGIALLKLMLPRLSQASLEFLLAFILDKPEEADLRFEILDALLPRVSPEQALALLPLLADPWEEKHLLKVLEQMRQQRLTGVWGKIVGKLVPHLPEAELPGRLRVLLHALRSMPDKHELWVVLRHLAVNVPESLLPELLEMLWSLHEDVDPLNILQVLFTSLGPAGWKIVLNAVRTRMHTSGALHLPVAVLRAFCLTVPQPALQEPYEMLSDILHLLSRFARHEALTYLGRLAPVVVTLGGGGALAEACCSLLEIGMWWP